MSKDTAGKIEKLLSEIRQLALASIQSGNEEGVADTLKELRNNLLNSPIKTNESSSAPNLNPLTLDSLIKPILDNTNDSIWVLDSNFQILVINNKFKQYFLNNFQIQLDIGANFIEAIPQEAKAKWLERFNRALLGESFKLADNFQGENNHAYIETSFLPIKRDGAVLGVCCCAKNTTLQRDSENCFQQIFESSYAAISIQNTEKILLVNEAWTKLSGYSKEEAQKIHPFQLIHPQSREEIKDIAISRLNGNEAPNAYTFHLITKEGVEKWVDITVSTIIYKGKNCSLVVGNDVTKIIRLKNNLIKKEAYLASILENTRSLIYSVDTEFCFVFGNSNFQRYYQSNYKNTFQLGRSALHGIPEEEATQLTQRLNKALSGQKFTVVDELQTESGTQYFEHSFNPIYVNNEIVGITCFLADISSLKITEKSLLERTKELDVIFDNAPVILMLVDESGNILNINKTGTEFTHSTNNKELINRLSGDIFHCVNSYAEPGGCGKGSSCKDCAIRNAMHITFNSKKPQNQVHWSLKVNENGQSLEKHFLVSTAFIDYENRNQVLIGLDDITDIHNAQEEINKLSQAVEQSPATVIITDTKGNIQYANPQFERSTGYKINDVLGKNPRFLKSGKLPDSDYLKLWKTISSGNTWQGEFLNTRKDGSLYWENAIISPTFNVEGEIVNYIAIKEDITERKEIQEDLIESEKELRQLNVEKSRFISIMAHDLRGLIGSYHAYSDLISSRIDNFSHSELKVELENLSSSSKESLRLLDRLLEWGKASLGKINQQPVLINLASEIASVIVLLSDMANAKHITLINKAKSIQFIHHDQNVLQTILRNLISNAIKFSPEQEEIFIGYEKKPGKQIEIFVEDHGVGMDEETLSKIFKPGETTNQIGTNDETGNGLGLLICDEMTKKMGGTLAVTSSLGNGSRFFFTIPEKLADR